MDDSSGAAALGSAAGMYKQYFTMIVNLKRRYVADK
jgi:hypothetical protein